MAWPQTVSDLERVQVELATRVDGVEPWLPSEPLVVGGCFLASGIADETRAWAAAVAVRDGAILARSVVSGEVAAPYRAGYLALRHGPLLEDAVRGLTIAPDVLLVDASGRDHPRGAGLALHLGAVLGIPTIGVTDRPLLATADEPALERGSASPLVLGDRLVGYAVRTRARARPVVAHAAWRTEPATARDLVARSAVRARTPEPLRLARHLARAARAEGEGRTPMGWRDTFV